MSRIPFRTTVLLLALISAALLCRAFCFAPEEALRVSGSAAPGGDVPLRVPVLMYHQFSDSSAAWSPWCMPLSELRADLEYLRKNGYTTILPRTLTAALAGEGTLPPKPVMLTFDDGHGTFSEWVLPLLEAFDMCAVVNVVGEYCDQYTETEDHTLTYSYLSWPEVGEVYASGRVEVGNHSDALHDNQLRKGIRILPGENREEYLALLREDTLRCQEKIEAATGVRPTVYAYPFGYSCPEAVELLTEMGYTVLLGCQEKVSSLYPDAPLPLCLERFNRPSGMSQWAYFQKALG